MTRFTDSLSGYAFPIYKRDHFKFRYCGADGTKSFNTSSHSCEIISSQKDIQTEIIRNSS